MMPCVLGPWNLLANGDLEGRGELARGARRELMIPGPWNLLGDLDGRGRLHGGNGGDRGLA